MTTPFARRVTAVLSGAALLAGASACSSDPNSVAEQAKQGSEKGYVAGDGSIVTTPPEERKEPITLTGPTLDGEELSLQDLRGEVVVVNLWASWCGPCEREAPHLVAVHDKYQEQGAPVRFVGIDYREPSIETGKAQAAAWGFVWPSIFDKSGSTAIDMQGVLATQPSTAVLDREGRVAAVVQGVVSESTLTGLVDDVLAESPAQSSDESSAEESAG